MHTRFYLALALLVAIALSLLCASYALAAPAPTPPSWAWACAGGCIALLVAVVGWWVRRWVERREVREDLLISRLERLDHRLDTLGMQVAILIERVDTLPCRKTPKNGGPPSLRCILKDVDYETDP